MSERVDAVVVGAGVIGLAVGRALALAGREVLVLEAEAAIGTGTSSRNSEVIHAGLYYPAGSLKARFCVEGRRALHAYAAARGFAAKPVGKIIVATDEGQRGDLDRIAAAAIANGVDDLRLVGADEVARMEPEVRAVAALHSPSTGIVDTHAYMLALQGDLENAGGAVVLHAPVIGGRAVADGVELDVGGAEPITLEAKTVVIAAGLGAVDLARSIAGLDPAKVPVLRLAKGNYFALSGVKAPFRRLVYPVPEPGGLGTHATLDLGGEVRFGPDVEWIDRIDYTVDPARGERFYAAIRRYWPGLPDGALHPTFAGIRPKLSGPGEAAVDFRIDGPAEHGVAGLWNLYGFESPGLTGSLAIGRDLAARIEATAPVPWSAALGG